MAAAAEVMIGRLLDRAVARATLDSPRAAALIASLQGRRLAIRISGSPWSSVVESTGSTLKACRVTDAGTADKPADATITGAPLSLLALAGADAQSVIQRGDVRIEGDAEIAQQFRELGRLLRPDLEAILAGVLGRSGAHIAMQSLRAATDWTRAAAWTQIRNVSEYLAHERGDLVPRTEAEHYLSGVDQLREQLDRIDARLTLAEQRAREFGGGPGPPSKKPL
jgi:ubiquinone biosynthesis accessory factor UbiJ